MTIRANEVRVVEEIAKSMIRCLSSNTTNASQDVREEGCVN